VLEGVLHDRLQDHPRHLAVERLWIDVHAHFTVVNAVVLRPLP
jgi:hypothetical protein